MNIFWNNLHILHSIKVSSIKNVKKKNELESNIFCFVPMPTDWSKDTVAYYYHCKFYPCYFYKKNHDQAKSLNLLYLWIGVDKFCFSVTCEFHRNRLLRFWDNVTEKADYKAIAIRSSVERKTLITPNIKKKLNRICDNKCLVIKGPLKHLLNYFKIWIFSFFFDLKVHPPKKFHF